jgi:methylase of polypeptide subunit release factors
MTESFDSKNDSETLVLLKERMREARERDKEFNAKLDQILALQHAMDTKTQITDHNLSALRTEHAETKARLDAVESDKRGVWAHVASIVSQIALWGSK